MPRESRGPGSPRARLAPALLWLALVGLLAALFAPTPDHADPASVRIGGSDWVADAPTKVAAALALFDEPQGTQRSPVEVVYFESGKESLEALLAGEVDFALLATTPLAIALVSEPPLAVEPVILASVALSNRTHVVVAAPERGIAAPADLAGRTVGLLGGTSAEFAWAQFAHLHGLEAASVTLLDMPVSALADAVVDGVVDAALLWHPWATELRRRLPGGGVVFSTRSVHTVSWLVVGTRRQVRASPELVERVLAGYLSAVDLIHRQPERARRLHAEAARPPLALLEELEERVIWSVGIDWSVLVNMHSQFTWLGERRGTRFAIPPPHTYLEPGPLARLAPQSVRLPDYLYFPPSERAPSEGARSAATSSERAPTPGGTVQ